MKSLFSGIFAFSLLFMMSCEPEEIQPGDATQASASTKSKVTGSVKSSHTALDSIAMAANIQELSYSNGTYNVSFYDGTGDYTVDINSFDDSTYIDYTMTSSEGAASDVTIDVLNEQIDIEGVGAYTFAEYENYVISSDEHDLKNLMVAVTVHHASNPNTSASFSDNGSGGELDPIPTKFWGTECDQGYTEDKCWETSTNCQKYRFWFKVGDPYDKDPVMTGNPGCTY